MRCLRLLWMGKTKGTWYVFWGAFWTVWSKSNLKIMCGIAESLRKVALLSFRREVCSSAAEAVEQYLRGCLGASETREGWHIQWVFPMLWENSTSGVESWEMLLGCLRKISYFLPSHGRLVYLGTDRLFSVTCLHMGCYIVDELSTKGKKAVLEKKV